ncbi:MAG: DUF1365 domain-containing protein [Gammaproteobacteria bacterium]|nr:DUF1365 domain-containing protein [Gammaproteobacteria bacterium]MBU1416073.1 DUF1365 domain-containing protein [Gammaproteobacteria bacterium]
MKPQLLVGHVMHRRSRPVINEFVYPVFCVQLPLTRLAEAGNAVLRIDRPGLMSFHQKDHGPRDGSPLLPWIRDLLRRHGLPVDGEILLQTFPRVLGYVFNPVSFWYCHDREGRLVAVLAEVNNTFGGHHDYLIFNPDRSPLRDGQVLGSSKAFHVSPFCEVQGEYRFRFRLIEQRAIAHIDYYDGDDAAGALLLTSISGSRLPWRVSTLLAAFLRMPLLTVGVLARIHWQALRLWIKRVPFVGAHPHPQPRPIEETSK